MHQKVVLLETAILGSFLALDLLLFFVFFEMLLLPMFLVIGVWGSERRVYASIKFFLFTMAGSAFLLLGIVFLWFQTAEQLGSPSFDIRQMEQLSLAATTQRWLFVAFFVAFAVKVPIFPLHTWLPDAHTEAPTVGSVLLGLGLIPFLAAVVLALRRPPDQPNDPWEANSLEWWTTSPPPHHNFTSLPPIRSERPVFDAREAARAREAGR